MLVSVAHRTENRMTFSSPGSPRAPSIQRGITMIELVLVLTIIAVLVSLASPSLGSLINRNRIVGAANELVAGINLARQTAVMKRQVTSLCPSTDGRTCTGQNRWDEGWIVFLDPDRNRQPDSDSDLLRVTGRLDGLHSDSAGRKRIRYFPSGFATGTNLTVKLCDPRYPEQSRAVIVSNSGRARVDHIPGHLNCPGS